MKHGIRSLYVILSLTLAHAAVFRDSLREHPPLHPAVADSYKGHEAEHKEDHARNAEGHEGHEGHMAAHEGHEGHEKEGSDPESFGLACFLMGGVAALMMIFYLVNMPTVKGATWKVLNMTTSIFVAVLIYGTVKTMLLELLEPSESAEVMIILALFVVCFLGTHALLYKIKMDVSKDDRDAAGVAVLAAHITGFAAMYGFADAVDTPFIEEMGGLGIILVIVFACLSIAAMMVLMDKTMDRVANADGTVDEEELEWMDLCRETDDDVFCLAISFLLCLYFRYLIRGSNHPYEPGHVGNVVQSDCNYLYLVACGFMALVMIGTTVSVEVRRYLSRHETRHPFFERALEMIQHCNFMSCAWCFLFWYEWQLYVLGWESTVIGGCLVVAVCVSLVSFGAVLIMYFFVVPRVPPGYGLKRALKSFELSLGILVGFSWERAFDIGFEEIELKFESSTGAERGQDRVLFYVLSLVLLIIVAPAWRLYIFPTAQKFEKLDEEEIEKSIEVDKM